MFVSLLSEARWRRGRARDGTLRVHALVGRLVRQRPWVGHDDIFKGEVPNWVGLVAQNDPRGKQRVVDVDAAERDVGKGDAPLRRARLERTGWEGNTVYD